MPISRVLPASTRLTSVSRAIRNGSPFSPTRFAQATFICFGSFFMFCSSLRRDPHRQFHIPRDFPRPFDALWADGAEAVSAITLFVAWVRNDWGLCHIKSVVILHAATSVFATHWKELGDRVHAPACQAGRFTVALLLVIHANYLLSDIEHDHHSAVCAWVSSSSICARSSSVQILSPTNASADARSICFARLCSSRAPISCASFMKAQIVSQRTRYWHSSSPRARNGM